MNKSMSHMVHLLRQQLSSIEGILKQSEGYRQQRTGSIGSLLKGRIVKMHLMITQIQKELKNK